jgi:hypothetical protein
MTQYNILTEFGVIVKLVEPIIMHLNEIYSEVFLGVQLSDEFPVQASVKQGDDLYHFFSNLLQIVIRKFQ